MPISERVTFPRDALRFFRETDAKRAMLNPDSEVPGAQDAPILLAEFWQAIELVAAAAAAGETWPSTAKARAALSDMAAGGGFGIRNSSSTPPSDSWSPPLE